MLFDEAEYDASTKRLSALTNVEPLLTKTLASEVRKYLALNLVAQRKQEMARREFDLAVKLNPGLHIGDEAVVSPKIRRMFYTIQDNTLRKTIKASRRYTLLRAAAWPGWGHVYRGEHRKGYIYMGAQFAALTGTALSFYSFIKARQAYTSFDDLEAFKIYKRTNSVHSVRAELQNRYDGYRSSARRTNLLIALSAGIWGVGLVDAYMLTINRDRVTAAAPGGAQATLTWGDAGPIYHVQYGFVW
ncbi:MAG: hypothetical protein FJY97_05910 [candidate division Zixibacteria bacterium]|nr:hypothetical protein [candidate division Zixibacteria bacterium]